MLLVRLIDSFAASLAALNHSLLNDHLLYSLAILSALDMILLFILIALFFALVKLASSFVKKSSKARFPLPSRPDADKRPRFSVGFFHPFCNSGGGGERVLWSAVNAIQKAYASTPRTHTRRLARLSRPFRLFFHLVDRYPNSICVIYSGDNGSSPDEMIDKAKERFTIELDRERTKFVFLRLRFLVLDKYYPMFTLLGE